MPLPAALAFLANPAFWGGAGKAAGGFIGAGGLGGLLGGGDDEKELKMFSTLDPSQQKLMQGLGEFLTGRVGEGATPFPGQLTAPLSEGEQGAYSKALQQLLGGGTETAATATEAFGRAAKGLSEKDVFSQYMKYTAPQEQKYLKEVSIPTFKESMVPGGTLRSTGTERGIGDIISQFGASQLGRIGERITSERAGARGVLPLAPAISALERGAPEMETASRFGGIARLVEQSELTAKLQEFIRTSPEMSPLLTMMMQLLQTQTMGAYFG